MFRSGASPYQLLSRRLIPSRIPKRIAEPECDQIRSGFRPVCLQATDLAKRYLKLCCRRSVALTQVPHSKHAKAVETYGILSLFNHVQNITINPDAALNPRTKTGLRWLICGGQLPLPRKESDFRLGEPGCSKRCQHLEFSSRLRARS